MPFLPTFIEGTHRQVAIRMNVERHFVAGDSLMWNSPTKCPAMASTKLPSEFFR